MKKKAQLKTTHGPASSKTPVRHTSKPRNEKSTLSAVAQAADATAVLEPVKPVAAPVAAKPPVTAAAVTTPAVTAPVVATPAVVSPAAKPVAAPVVVQPSARVIELIAQLRDGSAERAVEATEQLAVVGEAAAVEPLIAAVQNFDGYFHTVVRASAAMALGKIGDARAIDPLTTAAHDSIAEVSCEAILALGQLNAKAAAETLINIAANFSGYYLNVTRHAAIRSLGRMRTLAAQPTLEQLANSTYEDAAITAAARDALAAL